MVLNQIFYYPSSFFSGFLCLAEPVLPTFSVIPRQMPPTRFLAEHVKKKLACKWDFGRKKRLLLGGIAFANTSNLPAAAGASQGWYYARGSGQLIHWDCRKVGPDFLR
jgi:hypothetical protein